MQLGDGFRITPEPFTFGDLDFQPPRVHTLALAGLAQQRHQVALVEIPGRQVERQPPLVVTVPARQLGDGGADHPARDAVDQRGLLDRRDEVAGRDGAELRVSPAQQGLCTAQGAVGQGQAWLEGQAEVAAFEGFGKLPHQLEDPLEGLILRSLVESPVARAQGRLVDGHQALAQQVAHLAWRQHEGHHAGLHRWVDGNPVGLDRRPQLGDQGVQQGWIVAVRGQQEGESPGIHVIDLGPLAQGVAQPEGQAAQEGLEGPHALGQDQLGLPLGFQGVHQHQQTQLAGTEFGQLGDIRLELLAVGQAADRVASAQVLAQGDEPHHLGGEVVQPLAFRRVQFPWLAVENAQATNGIAALGDQGRTRIEAHMGGAHHQRVMAEARIATSIVDLHPAVRRLDGMGAEGVLSWHLRQVEADPCLEPLTVAIHQADQRGRYVEAAGDQLAKAIEFLRWRRVEQLQGVQGVEAIIFILQGIGHRAISGGSMSLVRAASASWENCCHSSRTGTASERQVD